MTPEQFAVGLRRGVVDDNQEMYRGQFGVSANEARDPHWKEALPFVQSLSDEQRRVFFAIVRLVTIDSVASVLAVIDGVSGIEGSFGNLALWHGDVRLDGDLLDLFLADIEAH